MIQHVKYAIRTLARTPGFLSMAVITFGLGIGATTAMFSLFYQVLLRDLPVPDPEQLVMFHSSGMLPGRTTSDNFESVFSEPLYLHLRDGSNGTLQALIARASVHVDLMRNGHTDRGKAEIVSGNFFQGLGLKPFAGRLLTPQDDTIRGGNNVVVLGYTFWSKQYGSTDVIGQKILVNGNPFQIVGIAPFEFRSVLSGENPDIYLPISMAAAADPGFSGFDNPRYSWLTLVGRLRPAVSRAKAQAALAPLFTSILRDELSALRATSAHSRDRILSIQPDLRPASTGLNGLERSWRKPLVVLLAAAAALLLIACSNLASLLMMRGAARQREIAIRRAIGGSRWQVVSQLLSESLVLAVLGGALGIGLAMALTKGILQLLPADATGGWVGVAFSWHIFAFALLLAALCGLGFGILPAWQVSAEHAAIALREQAPHALVGSHALLRKALVTVQIALCFVLLTGAGLFAKSLSRLLTHNLGFHSENLWMFQLDPALNRYTHAQVENLYAQLRERLLHMPGVTAVSSCDTAPFSNSSASTNVSIQGYQPREDENMDSNRIVIAPGFFHTLGVPLRAGREFNTADASKAAKVVIVNEAFVKRFFGARDPLGIHMSVGSGVPLDLQIVGVVPNLQLGSLRENPKPVYFLPFEQSAAPADPAQKAVFLMRTRADDAGLLTAARSIVGSLDRALPVTDAAKMQVQIQNSVYQDRALAVLTTLSGLLALLLASLGLYGVIAYAVTRRTSEIGVRMALGATRPAVLSLIMSEAMWMVSAGTVLGFFASFLLTRMITAQLYGVRPLDVSSFGISIGALFLVATIATAAPSLRATRIDPLRALRNE